MAFFVLGSYKIQISNHNPLITQPLVSQRDKRLSTNLYVLTPLQETPGYESRELRDTQPVPLPPKTSQKHTEQRKTPPSLSAVFIVNRGSAACATV